jgi:hypothetical protein
MPILEALLLSVIHKINKIKNVFLEFSEKKYKINEIFNSKEKK